MDIISELNRLYDFGKLVIGGKIHGRMLTEEVFTGREFITLEATAKLIKDTMVNAADATGSWFVDDHDCLVV